MGVHPVDGDNHIIGRVRAPPVSFQEGIGRAQGPQSKNILRMLTPTLALTFFCKAHPVPYAWKAKVEAELDRLKKDGIIDPIQFADWAAPVVPMLKQDKETSRLCGNFKVTVIKACI